VAQVKLIFASHSLTSKSRIEVLPKGDIRTKIFAYVEWFSKPSKEPHPQMQMYSIKRKITSDGQREGGIIELESIAQPCYLLPVFTGKESRKVGQNIGGQYVEVNGDNCIEHVERFWISSFHDQATYQIVF